MIIFHRLTLRAVALVCGLFALGGCAVLTPLPEPMGLHDRLKQFPTAGLPLSAPLTIYWDERQTPFIESESDTDAAFALGLVHAHLRLAQMEVLRRIAHARLAEMGGPLAIDIDHALRVLGIGRVAGQVLAAMPEDTRAWLDAFVGGINHYQKTMIEEPHEFAVLDIRRETWRPEDVIAIGRLGSIDVTWLVWLRLMELRTRSEWTELWPRLSGAGVSSVPSFSVPAGDARLAALERILETSTRAGSNSVVVGGARSASGAALIANDPHLGIALPNAWIVAGLKSPSHHAVGLMIPGLPFVAVGRNPWIAWGGTNMRAASSDLFDVTAVAPETITEREETIRVRWWFDRVIRVRETPHGPLMSDIPMATVRDGERIALTWVGHRPSDELTAMLRVNRARDWDGFRRALEGFAISPQNFVFADTRGNIGQVSATHLPSRPLKPPADLVRPISDAAAWRTILTSAQLPQAYNPSEGFLASANNRPAEAPVLMGYFFSSNDRVSRLKELLSGERRIDAGDLKRLQRDTMQRSSLVLRDALLARLSVPPALDEGMVAGLEAIKSWDGRYEAGSRGALAFEAAMASFLAAIYSEDRRTGYASVGRPYTLVAEDLPTLPSESLDAAWKPALAAAGDALAKFGTWGAMHRMPIQHQLANLPVVGNRYRFDDLPASGSSETVLKTAHSLSGERHFARFGANARHVSDLADPDANWFVLLGGQDGWLNSATFRDQVGAFQAGETFQVPLTLTGVRQSFRHRTILSP